MIVLSFVLTIYSCIMAFLAFEDEENLLGSIWLLAALANFLSFVIAL